jgi:hypothetical protein
MTINNQCSNIELKSPVYFTKDVTQHIQLPQQVDSNRIMRTNFITSTDQDTFGGVLLYRLQRKENDKSDKDTSISTQLLVIWGYKHNEPYSHALLIEYEDTSVWKKDKLKRLYNVYSSQYDIGFNTEVWSLDDNEKLKTAVKTSDDGFKMEITISEEYFSYPRKVLWIDSNR